MSERSIAILGDSIRCPRDKEFMKVIRQEVKGNTVIAFLQCLRCGFRYKNPYTINEYIKMGEMALLDKPEIIDFQRKMVIEHGCYIPINKGLQGAYLADPSKRNIYQAGRILICKCARFYSLTIKKLQKDGVEFSGYCGTCTPKSKILKLKLQEIVPLGKAGVLDEEIYSQIREEYRDALQQYRVDETYRGNDGTLAPWVQEQLGMTGDKPQRKCYICSTPIAEGVQRCPKCGADVDMDI